MKEGWQVPELTNQRQALAAEPGLSAWVSANAGSGKTHVLVNRVLRLLLAGVAPGRMLCITYTKAAAANMANRIFAALSAWATLDEAALADTLQRLTGTPSTPAERAKARRLFAEGLETPGGLKIETIHAFCTRVLQSAPFEANVPPRFEVADDIAQAEMLREARRELLAGIAADPQGEEAAALDVLARLAAQDTFDGMITEALGQRHLFTDAEGRPGNPRTMRKTLCAFLGISPDLAAAEIQDGFRIELGRIGGLPDLVAALQAGSATRQICGANLAALLAGEDGGDPVAVCRRGFLTEAGEINSHVRGRGKSEFQGPLLDTMEALAASLKAALDKLAAIAIRERSHAMAVLVTRMLTIYQRLKARRSLLDYEDLIGKTRSLFARVEASWVLYKLDAGIDHVLLDEAQDTSDAQWSILGSLMAEFFAGEGASRRSPPRTVFVVGDEKQSIYGFQGAAPAAFGEQRRALGRRVGESGERFEPVALNTSFRSTFDIMAAVDAVFARPDHARGLVFDGADRPEPHDTVRRIDAGCVDLWPLAADDQGEPPDAWTTPVDAPERRSGTMKLAARIAATLARWNAEGRDDLGRPFRPGDVMILLRQRGALFETIVKALKDANVPVAGRDRLTLAEHPAVEDLVVLGKALLLPDDDLTLATALKTPLIGLDDEDLLRLAPKRPGSLRQALRDSARTDLFHAEAERRLEEWTAEAGRCGPFRFFADLLGPKGGRNLALARLGAEAGDALDVFLNVALDYERREGPSLSGFLRHVEAAATDVKRDLSASAGEVRVMTVHGSKGLEARIVILADLGLRPSARRLPKILAVTQENRRPVPLWPPASAEDAEASTALKEKVVAQMIEEHHRLLYVAMTRAEDRLIVCGTQAKGDVPEGSWYGMIQAGLETSEAGLKELDLIEGEGPVRRFMVSPMPPPAAPVPVGETPATLVPDWLGRPVAREAEPAPPLKPSSALAAADGEDRPADGPFLAEAAAAGRFAHLLLQMLPEIAPQERPVIAEALARSRGATVPGERRSRVVGEVLALLGDPALSQLFAGPALAEVAISGEIELANGSLRKVSGQIDRLAIGADEIVIADYKTAARPPASVEAIPPNSLLQLAVYRELVSRIYPGRRVRALLLYTAGPTPLEPDAAMLDAALAAFPNVDAGPGAAP